MFRYLVNRNETTCLTSRLSALSCYCAGSPSAQSSSYCQVRLTAAMPYWQRLAFAHYCILCFQNVFVFPDKQNFVILCFSVSLFLLSQVLGTKLALGIHKGSDGPKGSHDTVQAGIPVIHSAALWWRQRVTAAFLCSYPVDTVRPIQRTRYVAENKDIPDTFSEEFSLNSYNVLC